MLQQIGLKQLLEKKKSNNEGPRPFSNILQLLSTSSAKMLSEELVLFRLLLAMAHSCQSSIEQTNSNTTTTLENLSQTPGTRGVTTPTLLLPSR